MPLLIQFIFVYEVLGVMSLPSYMGNENAHKIPLNETRPDPRVKIFQLFHKMVHRTLLYLLLTNLGVISILRLLMRVFLLWIRDP